MYQLQNVRITKYADRKMSWLHNIPTAKCSIDKIYLLPYLWLQNVRTTIYLAVKFLTALSPMEGVNQLWVWHWVVTDICLVSSKNTDNLKLQAKARFLF